MSAYTKIIKQILVRTKQKDFEFIIDNWSVFRSGSFDLPAPAVGRGKTKFITALLERTKVITDVLFVDLLNMAYVLCLYLRTSSSCKVVFSMPVAGSLTVQLACRQYHRNGNVIGCFK